MRSYHVRRAMSEIGGDPYGITTEDLINWLASKTWKPNTRRTYRASLRAFYQWAQATGRRADNPAMSIPSITMPRGLPRPAPEPIYRGALADSDERTVLMVTLAGGYGLRRGEVARARREDVVPSGSGYALRVIGKGSHVRLVPLNHEFAHRLLQLPPGWIFPSSSTRGGRAGTHLTPAHVGKLVSHALPGIYACHSLRHRAGTVAYNLGGRDLRAVQEFLGHAKPETTALYTYVDEDAIRTAASAAAA